MCIKCIIPVANLFSAHCEKVMKFKKQTWDSNLQVAAKYSHNFEFQENMLKYNIPVLKVDGMPGVTVTLEGRFVRDFN